MGNVPLSPYLHPPKDEHQTQMLQSARASQAAQQSPCKSGQELMQRDVQAVMTLKGQATYKHAKHYQMLDLWCTEAKGQAGSCMQTSI